MAQRESMFGTSPYGRLSGLLRRASAAAIGIAGVSADAQATAASDDVRRVRGYDFSGRSDQGLRDALARLRTTAESVGDRVRYEVFALVDEAVRRRLGAWRLFDAEFDHSTLVDYRRHAARLKEISPHRSRIGYYTDDAFFESRSFIDSLEAPLTELGLEGRDRTIVTAMVRVSEESGLRYRSDIMLPAEFYAALAATPAAEALTFRATDQQIMAARHLYDGRVVEMHAGEGKTVAAAFPAVLHALMGRKVHVVTANDYLASRDAEWLAPVYESLGLEVRAVLGHMSDPERRHAYQGDVVYGPLRELGFDFLRDNLRYSEEEIVQGPLEVAIVDEADQTLIDESRLPLIISGGAAGSTRAARKIRKAVEALVREQAFIVRELVVPLDRDGASKAERRDLLAKLLLADPENGVLLDLAARKPHLFRRVQQAAHGDDDGLPEDGPAAGLYYAVDRERGSVATTEKGEEFLERRLGRIFSTKELELQVERADSSYHRPLEERRRHRDRLMRKLSRQYNQMNLVFQMLRAFLLLERDVDYVVSEGEIVLIDKLTGRTRPDNRYQHGLHAALQAKEGLQVRPEGQAVAEISVQGFIKQYAQLSGMTGTALSSFDEFRRAYGLEVVAVPDAQPSRRSDLPTRLYSTTEDKLQAIVEQVLFWRTVGRPLMIAALTVRQADEISQLLHTAGVGHRRLDAANSADEADVVRLAGEFGAVTVATNMAGRGTDIVLNPGLDDRILGRYVGLVEELLSHDSARVVIACPTDEEAKLLVRALRDETGLVVEPGVGSKAARVTATKDTATRHGETAHLEFGLGVLVIGTEMNESLRIDSQLRGRSGRQGGFGASKFMLSLQDRHLVQGHSGNFHRVSDGGGEDGKINPFLEGARTEKQLRAVQEATELDDEMIRGLTWDYSHAVEWQSMSYYRARRKLMAKTSFQAECVRFMRRRAARLVDEYLPLAMIGDYAAQFDRLAEEVALDYGADCEPMWGLGIDTLKRELAHAMVGRLQEKRARFDEARFDRIAKLVFLQTADELWAEHLSRLGDLMVSARLGAHEHRTAVAGYVFLTSEEGGRFMEQVIDNFLPRLMSFAERRSQPLAETDGALTHELQEILI